MLIKKIQNDIESRYQITFDSYEDFYQWSVENLEEFWSHYWDVSPLKDLPKGERVLSAALPHFFKNHFFPDASLNYAELLLQRRDEETALYFWGEDRVKRTLTFRELWNKVSAVSHYFKQKGIGPGDRVAAYVPNTPETLIAMLAVASLGAVWSSCSPDFGVQGALDRFQQIEPKFLVAADGYYYQGKVFSSLEKLRPIVEGLPTLQGTLVYSYVGLEQSFEGDRWEDVINQPAPPLVFEKFPFNHPLFILFSSGTTGKPKCIVHGAGGTLLEHLKEHQLHGDLNRDHILFYFTTCGWMMWNWQVSALALGTPLALFDGSPVGSILFDYVDAVGITHFGTSAKYIDSLAKSRKSPRQTHSLSTLKAIFSTGSPLSPEGFDYIENSIKPGVDVASVSGGTDILGCFFMGSPLKPTVRGQLKTRSLGCAVNVFNEKGEAVVGQKGELVCTKPFPSMPLAFWDDEGDAKYKKSYFNKYPNIWCHGDFVELTPEGGAIIHGRSDAVLNPGGVRIGTAEIYRQVEQFDDVLESVAVGQKWDNDVRVVLFVKLREGLDLTQDLIQNIKQAIRKNTTPRHVPAKIIAVPDIPKTKNGKISELAVRDAIHDIPVVNTESLANPECLKFYGAFQFDVSSGISSVDSSAAMR